MNLNNITVTEITDVVTIYSEKGRRELMTNRKCYGLSLCASGQITYIQNGVKYVSDKDHAVILPKYGSYFISGDKTGYFPVINFECPNVICDTIVVIPTQNAEQLIFDYERLKKLFYFDGNRAQIFSIFYDMLHKLCPDDIPRKLKKAIQLIRTDFCDPSLTNTKLAAECNVSEIYFRKLFTKHFGSSPKQFIIDMRIQNAKQLLAEGELNVEAISEKCGFSNPYHFCRLFKQHVGTTPSKYRKENLI